MRFLALVSVLLTCAGALLADQSEFPSRLTPPAAKDVAQVENMPDNAPIYIYSSGERKFTCSRKEILHFLTQGQARAVSWDSQKLWDIAPFTPPRKLTEQEKMISFGVPFVVTGALSTRDGSIYFWRKLNDRVLYLAQHDSACYLILPESKP